MFGALNRLGFIGQSLREAAFSLFKPSGSDSLITDDNLTFRVRD